MIEIIDDADAPQRMVAAEEETCDQTAQEMQQPSCGICMRRRSIAVVIMPPCCDMQTAQETLSQA